MRSGLAAAASAVLLVAAACSDDGYGGDDGGSDDTTEAPPEEATDVFDRDACELLSDDQVAEVLGDDVDEESTPGDASIAQPAGCTWSVPDATIDFEEPQPTGVTVFLGDRQIYDNTRILAEDGDTFEELDIGDEAYAGDAEGGVLVGEVAVTVTPIGTDANDPSTHDLVVDLLGQVAENV
jgi:Protein of unknown function (DUF3558)